MTVRRKITLALKMSCVTSSCVKNISTEAEAIVATHHQVTTGKSLTYLEMVRAEMNCRMYELEMAL
jgi:hypothetical protein